MRVSATIVGDGAVRKRLQELEKLYPDALGAALYQEGLGIWNGAVKRAPVEFGVLRNSAYVGPPTKQSGEIAIEVGFGTKYAAFQHQGEQLHHPRGGEAGFLAKTINERASGFLERLAQRTEENVARNVRAPAIGAPTAPPASGSRRRARLSARRSRR